MFRNRSYIDEIGKERVELFSRKVIQIVFVPKKDFLRFGQLIFFRDGCP